MASFNELMADKNKLEELKIALAKSEQDYPEIAPTAAEAGYPIGNEKAQTIRKQIAKLEQKIAANDQF
jgi:5,10-methylenetetrahydrofolate reductase